MKSRAAEIVVVTTCLGALLASFIVGSRWPLVGDSILMHYVVWLTRHGFAPYRDVAEMNLPLTYMSEDAAMRIFGMGAAGWRLYDGFLVLAVAACCWRLLRQHGIAAGLFVAALFATVHLQDGIHMAGQRDLLVTVLQAGAGCILLSTHVLASTVGRQRWQVRFGLLALFGMLSTAAACIKPPAILFGLFGLAWFWFQPTAEETRGWRAIRIFPAVFAGACLPLLLCLVYLLHFGALGAFLQEVHGLIAYHAGLERRPAGFLLGHIWSPVLPFFLVALIAMALPPRARWSGRDTFFALAAAAGLVSYLAQGKGFPYQRYPFLLWTLLLCASRLWATWERTRDGLERSLRGARQRSAHASVVGASLAIGSGVGLMALFLLRSTHFSHADPYFQLEQDLAAHTAQSLHGRVQCLDTAGPCIGALYEARLTQTTGFLYDCYLLDGRNAVAQQQRALLEREWARRTPQFLVLTDSNCFTGARTFDKYGSWPWMQQQLARYNVVLERHPAQPLRLWSRPEQPYAYRILVRRNGPQQLR